MPVYNASEFLEACLKSIIEQTFINWELIAVDDFSTDTSLEILKSYENQDGRIKVLQNSDKGIIPALNHGYSRSKGQYITRMDADDIMPINKLMSMRNSFNAMNNNHTVTGQIKYISKNKLGDGFKRYEVWINELVQYKKQFSEIYKECVIPSPCWMMERVTFESIGGFKSKVYPEDYDLCFRMYKNNIDVVCINETLHIWRDYSNRTSRIDPNYSDNNFLELKANYFLEIDRDITKELVIWGAGRKGKALSKILNNHHIEYEWACNNINKIGHYINDKTLLDIENVLYEKTNKQVIIAVANYDEQLKIREILEQNKQLEPFWFC